MDYVEALAISGVWLAIYPTGQWIWTRFHHSAIADVRLNPLLTLATGSAVWTLVLMLLGITGAFHSAKIGLAGWCVVIAWCAFYRPWSGSITQLSATPTRSARSIGNIEGACLTLVLCAAGALYALFPKESIFNERDEGIYVQHALHLSQTGHSSLDMQAYGLADNPFILAIERGLVPDVPGIYPTGAHWIFQFSSATSTWMALLNAQFGVGGLYRFNALIGVLTGLSFFFLARRCLPAGQRHWAIAALALYVFNPSQVWISRNTLSEPFCAWFAMTGLLALSTALGTGKRTYAAIGGILIGMTVFVRIDAVVFPLALAVAWCIALWLGRRDASRAGPFDTAMMACAVMSLLALTYYAVFVTPYARGLMNLLIPVGIGTLAFIILAVVLRSVSDFRFPPTLANPTRAVLIVSAIAVFVYAMWLRPYVQPYSLIESKLVPQLNGTRDYSELALYNVSAYLALPTVLAACVGLLWNLNLAIQRRLTPSRLMIFVFLLIPTVIYLWRPMVSPDHIWASRRWVPTVFTTVVLLAAQGVSCLAKPFSRAIALPAACVTAALACAFMLWSQRETLWLKEDGHLFNSVTELAHQLSKNEASYIIDGTLFTGALWAGFGRPVVPVRAADFRINHPALPTDALCRLPKTCLVVHFPAFQPQGRSVVPVATLTIDRLRRKSSVVALPQGTYRETYTLQITRVGW